VLYLGLFRHPATAGAAGSAAGSAAGTVPDTDDSMLAPT